VHDLAATKLKRHAPQDRQDLMFLCDSELIEKARLREALEAAFRWNTPKDGDDYDRAFANLARVDAYLDGRSASL
jgi:hypothetical protein